MNIRTFARRARRNGAELVNILTVRNLPRVHSQINERAAYAARFARVAVNGKMGCIVEGMDCDCTQYRYESVVDVPASLMAHQKAEDDAFEWLDGPQSTYYVAPGEVDDGYRASADRALEAFEDGHPGTVYWGAL